MDNASGTLFFHKTCPFPMLKALIQEVLGSLFDLGETVLATISDQGPTNRGAINLLKNSEVDDVCYEVLGQRLVHIFDTHILKNVRNNLITSDLEFDGNKFAERSTLIEFFNLDESSFKMSYLTYKHLNTIRKFKMKVKPAAEVVNETAMKSILGI